MKNWINSIIEWWNMEWPLNGRDVRILNITYDTLRECYDSLGSLEERLEIIEIGRKHITSKVGLKALDDLEDLQRRYPT